MSNGNTCTADEQALFISSHGASIVCLTRGDSIGLTLVAESGFISLVAVLAAFTLIFYNAFQHRRLIRHSTDIYMLALFTFDIIMALGRVLDVKWIHEGKLHTGTFCTAQGIVQQIGETGSALATLAIAVHTFVVVMWDIRPPQHVAYTVVGLTWMFIAFFIAMTVAIHTRGSQFYETPVGYWCWIGIRFKAEQISGQYIWVWVTIFVSFLTYTTLFFWARGNISDSEQHWWIFRVQRSIDARQRIDPNEDNRWRSVRMIVYPIVFAVTTLPLSVVRWKSGFGSSRRSYPTATFVVEFIYSLSGAFNVLLFLFTRADLLLPHNRLGVAPGFIPPAVETRLELTPVGRLPGENFPFNNGFGETSNPALPESQIMGVTTAEPSPGLNDNPHLSPSDLGSGSPDGQIEVGSIPGGPLPRGVNDETSNP